MSKKDFRMYENLTLISQIGIMMVVPIMGGLWLGNYLDERFNKSPLFLLSFIGIGAVSSFYNLYRFAVNRSDRGRKR